MTARFLDSYEPVEDRLRDFHTEHPYGRILTELIHHGDGDYIVKATIYRGDEIGNTPPAATGLAHDSTAQLPANMKASALEVCETSAIGRALANLGYAPKGKRPSREEMLKASPGSTAHGPATTGTPAGNAAQGQRPGASSVPARGSTPVATEQERPSSEERENAPTAVAGTTPQGSGSSSGSTSDGVIGLDAKASPRPAPSGSTLGGGDGAQEFGEGSTAAAPSSGALADLMEAVGGSEAKAINAVNKAQFTAYKKSELETLEPEDWEAGLRQIRGGP